MSKSQVCAGCGGAELAQLYAQLPACSFGCAIAAGIIPVGLVVELDGSSHQWTIQGGNRAELIVRAASLRRRVSPVLVSAVIGWSAEVETRDAIAAGEELELEPEVLWTEHMGRGPEEVRR